MANKFLDSTGTGYLWGKMKTWVNSQGFLKSYTDTNTWRPIKVNGATLLNGSTTATNILNLKPGNNVTLTTSGGDVIINSSYTNTWRDVVDNLTSTATDKSLSANQGKILNDKFANYLPKTTYEYNKEIAFGSTGKLCIGKFPMYDSNLTVTIKATTSTTYYGVLVIATQNVKNIQLGTLNAFVYGDASNTIAPNIYIEHTSGTNVIGVYFSPQPYSKNLIHIQAHALNTEPNYGTVAPGGVTNVCTSISEIPSTATKKPTNILTTNFQAKGNYLTGITKNMVTTALGYTPPTTDTNTWRSLSIDGTEITPATTAGGINFKAGTNMSIAYTGNGFTFSATDTNTWRGIQNNLTSTSTTDSLSAYQGKVLNDKISAIIDGSQVVQNAVDADAALYASEAGSVAWANITGKTNATTSTAGLMSATDKSNLDTIVNSFNSDDADSTIETVKEVLKVFESYPAGTSLSNALAGKLDTKGGTLTGTVTMSNGDFLARYVGISAAGHETSTYDKIAILSNTTNGYIRYRTKSELLSDIGAQAKVSALGNTNKPVYISAAGTFSACNLYGGGTAVTLNGTNKTATDASFYAPTSAGTKNYVLLSNGSGAPSWVAQSSLSVGSADEAGYADTAGSATKATQDGNGNIIVNTYATKKDYLSNTTAAFTYLGINDKAASAKVADSVAWANVTDKPSSYYTLPARLATGTTTGGASNDATEQGWYYIARGDANRPPFLNVVEAETGTDYRVMTNAHSVNWLQQIATNFRSNDIFIRRRQSGTWMGWTSLVKMEEGLANPTGTANAVPRWHGSVNSTLKDSKVTIDDNGVLNAPTLKENGTVLSKKYQEKGTYITPTTGSEYYPKYIQTRLQNKTSWYGTQYPIYAWWETGSICKWVVDNYETKVDRAVKDADGNNIASTYLPLSGGTITAGSTITLGATSNTNSSKLKWGTVNSKTPYFGYASDQTDGTFVWSITGTTYATGLAIGGGSGNLLWKGNKVVTTSDLSNYATQAWVYDQDYFPSSGGTIGGDLTVEGTISSNNSLFAVEFYEDGVYLEDKYQLKDEWVTLTVGETITSGRKAATGFDVTASKVGCYSVNSSSFIGHIIVVTAGSKAEATFHGVVLTSMSSGHTLSGRKLS